MNRLSFIKNHSNVRQTNKIFYLIASGAAMSIISSATLDDSMSSSLSSGQFFSPPGWLFDRQDDVEILSDHRPPLNRSVITLDDSLNASAASLLVNRSSDGVVLSDDDGNVDIVGQSGHILGFYPPSKLEFL